ncbi:MAG: hypothetical protein KBG28_16095 [Kofleriaceae bacterium]|nr:hypothetical protein [Kofleriaceae bacterium]MBP6840294.1 hypothetical protein [Kofleriaceae bacterium]MBP9205492.1 hypothetical protein [Kofleriaceae bacterium]
MTRRLLAPLLLASLGACLGVPEGGPAPMCVDTSECEAAAGEVCAEGVCWGDPPTLAMAAIVGPPDVSVLAGAEVPSLSIARDGWMADLVLDAGVLVAGRVQPACVTQPCDQASLAALVTVTRASRIPGGPTFRVSTRSTAGVTDATQASFQVRVPRSEPGERYIITVVGLDADGARLPDLPVDRRELELPGSTVPSQLRIELGGASQRLVSGSVSDGAPLVGYQVVARARWSADGPLEELSSIATTDASGAFTLGLPLSAQGPIEVVARPPEDVVAPSLRRPDIELTDGVTALSPLRMPAYPAPVSLTLPVRGPSSDGAIEPVSGARVTATTTLEPPVGPLTFVEFEASAETDPSGVARLRLIPPFAGNVQAYQFRVVPPAGAKVELGAAMSVARDLGAMPLLSELILPRRVAIRGQLASDRDVAIEGVAVRATPNLGFVYELDPELQRLLGEIAVGTDISRADGSFVVWVEPEIGGQRARYDLVIDAQGVVQVPNWQVSDVAVAAEAGVDLGPVTLPPAAFVRGVVTDAEGVAVPGAEVRVLALSEADLTCRASNAPANCTAPAVVLARGESDEQGVVRLVLPDIAAAP